jgi:chromosome condensin MukBEF ATPase and DNA-binding subunit MukB
VSQQHKRKPTKVEQHAAIKAARGMLRPKPGEPSFAEQMAKWKAEDRELERRRDERLAALIKK